MVNTDLVLRRIEQIENHILKITPYMRLPKEDFLKDGTAQDVVEYNLFQITNHIIDIVQHIVVDEDYGFPQTAYESSQILCDKGIFSKKDLEVLKRMIGFRNVVGHDYSSINKEIVYDILMKGKKDVQGILSKITNKFF